jgi:dihydropteroate synthase
MGIVNVTPDSFSDGGRFFETDAAVKHALQLVQGGANILDLGGESTRPGSDAVSAEEELHRLMPVILQFRNCCPDIPISIDTTKAAVAKEVLDAGAEIINDVSGLADPDMPKILRQTGAGYCLMHTQGIPKTMQNDPQYDDVVQEVLDFLKQRRQELINFGIEPERIAVDPGIGFGKTAEHNWALIEEMDRFHELGAPLLVGHSRKRFMAQTYPDRDAGTRIVTQRLLDKGVHIIRLHEVSGLVRPSRSSFP